MKIAKFTATDLNNLIDDCEGELLNQKPVIIYYPEELRGVGITEPDWDNEVKNIKNLNDSVLSKLTGNANIYAIFISDNGKNWKVTYVGQRKSSGMRQRIIEHLITKNEETGSKLEYVRDAVSKGKKIGIRCILVFPDSLRLFVEESIILRNKKELKWNIQG